MKAMVGDDRVGDDEVGDDGMNITSCEKGQKSTLNQRRAENRDIKRWDAPIPGWLDVARRFGT